jgi:hypothetical protein
MEILRDLGQLLICARMDTKMAGDLDWSVALDNPALAACRNEAAANLRYRTQRAFERGSKMSSFRQSADTSMNMRSGDLFSSWPSSSSCFGRTTGRVNFLSLLSSVSYVLGFHSVGPGRRGTNLDSPYCVFRVTRKNQE